MRLSATVQLALLAAALLAATGCEDDDSPTGPTPVTGDAAPSSGTSRLVWGQIGDTSKLRFRAYINNRAVELTSAACNSAKPEAECTSPLPALTDGSHTIELVSVGSGLESDRSRPVTF